MLSLSQHASVLKKVIVMTLPMASEVGVMEHVWLLRYADGKLGERMQFVAVGSTVHRPEVTVKYCALVKPTIIMSRKAPHVPLMREGTWGRSEGYSILRETGQQRTRASSDSRKDLGGSGVISEAPAATRQLHLGVSGTSLSPLQLSR